MKKVAVLSSDTDWADEETVREAWEFLASLGKPISLYATSRYGLLDDVVTAKRVPLEVGPHPNLEGRDLKAEVEACLAQFPETASFRAHSLHFTERLRPLLRERGVHISSNAIAYLQPDLRPYDIGWTLTEVPIFWMDAFHLEYCGFAKTDPLEVAGLGLERPGLKVFDIHPVHLALNTESMEHYGRAKHAYHDPAGLRREANRGRGVRDLLVDAIQRLDELGYEWHLVRDVPRALTK